MVTELATLLARHQLVDWADRILATQRPSLRLGSLRRGRLVARIGGMPRLNVADLWPEADGKPLSFIAEVDLAAASSLLGEGTLPANGYLEFFYDAEQEAWGFDPADRPKWRVLWVRNDATRRDLPLGLPDDVRFTPVDLEGHVEPTYAEWESWHFAKTGMDLNVGLRYANALAEWNKAREPKPAVLHRLLGHPDHVQGDMMLECQLASNGIKVGNLRAPSEAEARLEAGAGDWRLLLQIDSDEHSNMSWGDTGRIYYWIRDEDLRERNWDRVWLVLQCS